MPPAFWLAVAFGLGAVAVTRSRRKRVNVKLLKVPGWMIASECTHATLTDTAAAEASLLAWLDSGNAGITTIGSVGDADRLMRSFFARWPQCKAKAPFEIRSQATGKVMPYMEFVHALGAEMAAASSGPQAFAARPRALGKVFG